MTVRIDPGELPADTYFLEWDILTPEGDHLLRRQPVVLAGEVIEYMITGDVPVDPSDVIVIRLRGANQRDTLAATTIRSSDRASAFPGDSIVLIVGDHSCGLQAYDRDAISGEQWTQLATVVRALPLRQLPDNLAPLSAVSTMVLTGTSPPSDPARLALIRSWMEQGGHVVISLPANVDAWSLERPGGPWEDLLPTDVEVASSRPWEFEAIISPDPLTTSISDPLPVRTFDSAVSASPWWHIIHRTATGSPITIARDVGLGRLTVTGLDASSPALRAFRVEGDATGPLPAAGTFWKPILARRDIAPTPRQIRLALEQSPRAASMERRVDLNGARMLRPTRSRVETSGRVLAVLAWLAICWVIGGPVIWSVLGKRGRRDLAWPAFAVFGCVAAIAAWALGGSLGLHAPHARHVSVVDLAHDGGAARTRSWLELGLPGDGRRDVAVADAESATRWIAPWRHPGDPSLHFSDTRELIVDGGSAPSLPVQARGTTQGVYLDVTGPSLIGSVSVITPVAATTASDTHPLQGVVRNDLGAVLNDVSISWVEARRQFAPSIPSGRTTASGGGEMPSRIWTWRLHSWDPGSDINLTTLTIPQDDRDGLLREHIVQQADSLARTERRSGRVAAEALSLFSLQSPTEWVAPPSGTSLDHVVLHRTFGASLDLGPHLGTPMVLITGFLENAPIPATISIDDEAVDDTTGETLVRWRIPLNDRPPVVDQAGPNR